MLKQLNEAPKSWRLCVLLIACVLLSGVVSRWGGSASAAVTIADESAGPQTSIRVLTYNIHHGRGMDARVDLQRIAELIQRLNVDLVALQEVDDQTQRTAGVDQTAVLAELTQMTGWFAHQIDFEGGRYGQAILSRFPLREQHVTWLPGMPERERRIAGAVTVTLPSGQSLQLITTHLHHNNSDFRLQQAAELNRVYGRGNALTILAGDLNAVADSEPLRELRQSWTSATPPEPAFATFPADRPDRQLDFILYRPSERFRVASASVVDEGIASDHRPLLVELQIE